MKKILKFPKTKVQYSEHFLDGVKPDAIGNFIKRQNPNMSIRAADAMALAIIYSTYLQLVFDEEGLALVSPFKVDCGCVEQVWLGFIR